MPILATSTAPDIHQHGLADVLFYGTRKRLLGLLFRQPTISFYANELIDLAQRGSGAVQRELASFTESGLVTVRPVGKQNHFQANAACPIFSELCGIVLKTVGLADPLREALMPLAGRLPQPSFMVRSQKGRTMRTATST